MQRQVELVIEYAALREDRAAEVLSQVPQLATYWASVAGLHPSRTPRTLELVAAAVRLAIMVEMRFKHAFAFPRPVQYSPQVQPMILTPQHSSYPSGHSTEAHAVAYLLIRLTHATDDLRGQMLLKLAGRMAVNRTVAGVHYPIDSRAGQVLGASLADYLFDRCAGNALHVHRCFDPVGQMKKDFLAGRPPATELDGDGLTISLPDKRSEEPADPDRHILAWLWRKAEAEWE